MALKDHVKQQVKPNGLTSSFPCQSAENGQTDDFSMAFEARTTLLQPAVTAFFRSLDKEVEKFAALYQKEVDDLQKQFDVKRGQTNGVGFNGKDGKEWANELLQLVVRLENFVFLNYTGEFDESRDDASNRQCMTNVWG